MKNIENKKMKNKKQWEIIKDWGTIRTNTEKQNKTMKNNDKSHPCNETLNSV